GKKIFYVTNNSGKSRKQYAKKCEDLGFPATEFQQQGLGNRVSISTRKNILALSLGLRKDDNYKSLER
ncbi:hypothetical protein KUTeg_023358, partial [Tegillarca granosa]